MRGKRPMPDKNCGIPDPKDTVAYAKYLAEELEYFNMAYKHEDERFKTLNAEGERLKEEAAKKQAAAAEPKLKEIK